MLKPGFYLTSVFLTLITEVFVSMAFLISQSKVIKGGWVGGAGVDSPYVSKIHCDNPLLSYSLWYRIYELNQIPIEVYLLCLYLYLHWAGSRLVGGVWPLGHYELPPNVSIPCNSPPSSSIIIIFKIQNTTKRTSIYDISLFNNGQMGLN